MFFNKFITILLILIIKSLQIDAIQTTSPVSIVFNGITLQRWNEQSLWNKTRLSIVQHLNQFCQQNYQCDAQYGIDNIHLIEISQYKSSSIRLNITADEPIPSSIGKYGNSSPSYNYTALLTSALFQSKIDLEYLNDHRSFYSSTYSHQNSFSNRTSRLFFVFLGITLVALIFGLTVLFFQRIRRHSYSKLLKPLQNDQIPTLNP